MGLYQLHFMQKPDYVVVNEMVNLLPLIEKSWAKGFVNGVLRNYARNRQALLAKTEGRPDFQYGHPYWFVARLQKAWISDWQTILQENDKHPPMVLRVNTRLTSRHDYLALLNSHNCVAQPHTKVEDALILEQPCEVDLLPGFQQGFCSIQDLASQWAPYLLNLKPGQRILDACAAPGGKTTHILEKIDPQCLVALDKDKKRLLRIQENMTRLKLEGATLLVGDALHPATWWDGILFDRILLDAPCSATGVIRRHPDIKLLRTVDAINHVVALQKALLEAMWPLLQQGGLLVYATCSVLPEENELQIKGFLQGQQDCCLVSQVDTDGRQMQYGLQWLPGDNGGDGFFYAVLAKN